MPDCPGCGYNPYKKYRDSDVSKLISMLQGSHSDVRMSAAAELGRRGDGAAVEPLIAALSDSEEKVVLPAVIALGRLGDQRAVEPLANVMRQELRGYLSVKAVEALVKIGDKRALEQILLLTVDRDANVRRWAFEACSELGRTLGDKCALEPILPLITDPDADVRRRALEACSELGWTLGDKRMLEQILPLTADPDAGVRRSAFKACSKLGWMPEEPEEKFVFLLSQKRWADLRALGPNATARAVKLLLEGDLDLDEGVSGPLSELGWAPTTEEEAFTYLKAGGDPETVARMGPTMVQPLIAALRSPQERLRHLVAVTLVHTADPEALVIVIKAGVHDGIRCGALRKYAGLR